MAHPRNRAKGEADLRGELVTDHHEALTLALDRAVVDFFGRYERLPEWDILTFRGAFTTKEAVLEIWEAR